jgi:hypothetical protein
MSCKGNNTEMYEVNDVQTIVIYSIVKIRYSSLYINVFFIA